MMTNVAKKLKAALLSAAVVMACAGQAQAASFQGDWDPAFGNPFPSLGWAGSVTFYVPDACLLLSGTINNSNDCAKGTMDLLTGRVDLYNLSDPGTILGSIYFGSPNYVAGENPNPDDDYIWVTIEGGTVTGLKADFDQWLQTNTKTVSIAGEPDTLFNLGFTGDCAQLRFRYTVPGNGQGRQGVSDPCTPTSGPLLTFTRLDAMTVPEPGSLALLLPAIGMLAAFRRRKPAPAAA